MDGGSHHIMRHAGLGDEMHFSFNKVEELNYARMGDSVTDWFSLFFLLLSRVSYVTMVILIM